jgi:hypothetical protein
MAKKADSRGKKGGKIGQKKLRAAKPKQNSSAAELVRNSFALPAGIPRYACTRTADDQECVRYEYNPATGNYDLHPTPIDCGACSKFLD